MTQWIVLLRGINVGRTHRIPMMEFRILLESLGYSKVQTLLNSGNAILQAPNSNARILQQEIAAAIETRFGFSVPVIAQTAGDFDRIVEENPLPHAAQSPSKFLVAFPASTDALAETRLLSSDSWAPDELAMTGNAAYILCNSGITQSRLLHCLSRRTGNSMTTRNWSTVLKLQAATGHSHQKSSIHIQ